MDIDAAFMMRDQIARCERGEALANAAMVAARARLDADIGARHIVVAGAHVLFDGVGSPLTQTFGIGMFEPFGASEFDAVEQFFDARGSSTQHEVADAAADETRRLLPLRGYVPIERSTVLLRNTATEGPATSAIDVRVVDADEHALWARTSAQGWHTVGEEVAAFVEQLGRVMGAAEGVTCFLAERGGEPVAAAALYLTPQVAVLAGASTVPSARGAGAQAALLQARLRHAQRAGISVAMVVTQPDSASQRNAERAGFRTAYGRTKWERPCAITSAAAS